MNTEQTSRNIFTYIKTHYARWWEKYLSKRSLIKHTCSWCDKLIVKWIIVWFTLRKLICSIYAILSSPFLNFGELYHLPSICLCIQVFNRERNCFPLMFFSAIFEISISTNLSVLVTKGVKLSNFLALCSPFPVYLLCLQKNCLLNSLMLMCFLTDM